MSRATIVQRIISRLRGGLDKAVIQGDGYEALITRDGIVVGRVYVGTVQEIEAPMPHDHGGPHE